MSKTIPSTEGEARRESKTNLDSRESRRTKTKSMKRAFCLFWHGLTALLVGMVELLYVILGMRDDSKYGKVLRRVVGTCFTLMVLFVTVAMVIAFYQEVISKYTCRRYYEDAYCSTQYLSPSVTYHTFYGENGYVKTSDGDKTIKGIAWIALPLGNDSLVCYSDGKKRGYFNKYTGEIAIRPKYRHAWIFSDGLASVDDEGWIKFIDASGRVVIDPKIPYMPEEDEYMFHDGRCIIPDSSREHFGLIDKQGKWLLEPKYTSVLPDGEYLIIENSQGQSVLDKSLNTLIPWTDGEFSVEDEYISVTLSNHVLQRYNFSGELVEDFYISDISLLTYESDELRYTTTKNYSEEGVLTSETEEPEPSPVLKVAKCRSYEAENGWYGLMTPDGRIVTPPSYESIKAIGYDLYLCKDNYDDGVVLNGRGEQLIQ